VESKLPKEKLLTIAIVFGFIIGLSSFIDAGVNHYNNLNRNKMELGVLVQNKFIENQIKITQLQHEIEQVKARNSNLLTELLKANGIVLKKGETCELDLKNWTLHFRKENQ
jgi:hypothetical protein